MEPRVLVRSLPSTKVSRTSEGRSGDLVTVNGEIRDAVLTERLDGGGWDVQVYFCTEHARPAVVLSDGVVIWGQDGGEAVFVGSYVDGAWRHMACIKPRKAA